MALPTSDRLSTSNFMLVHQKEFLTMPKRLAVVVPLYNPGLFLYEVLENLRSCAEAGQVPIDIFLVDDGESKIPAELELSAEQEWSKVTYWKNEHNLGETENVNKSFIRILELGYKFALLLHQDDFVSQTWLQVCAARAQDEEDSHGQLWFCDILSVDRDKSSDLIRSPSVSDLLDLKSVEFIQHRGIKAIESFYREYSWGPSGTLFHLDSFFEIGGFYNLLKYCADGDFGVRWLCNGFTMNVTKQAHCYRRIHRNQTTQVGILSGIADQSYAYIMIRYCKLAGLRRRYREHIAWAKRRLVTGFGCLGSPSIKCLTMHIAAFRIIFASFMTCLSPRFSWLLPKAVRVLLNNAPPVTFPA